MGDLDRRVAEHLVAQAGRGAIEVGELLRGQQDADARLAAAGQQRDHVVGAERRELVDADQRLAGLGRVAGPSPPPHQTGRRRQAAPAGAPRPTRSWITSVPICAASLP